MMNDHLLKLEAIHIIIKLAHVIRIQHGLLSSSSGIQVYHRWLYLKVSVHKQKLHLLVIKNKLTNAGI